jgi:hypothetical protein
MNVENMNELIEKLLAKEIIKPMTVECSDDFGWYDDNEKQYIVLYIDFMVTYCNDDGYITDLGGFGKDSENKWNGYTFDDSKIVVESIHDKILYSDVCNLSIWRKESL